MLFNEPKLLKCAPYLNLLRRRRGFSALQRAEIAEMRCVFRCRNQTLGFSALQRAEIAEMFSCARAVFVFTRFSALQRAEIAEM